MSGSRGEEADLEQVVESLRRSRRRRALVISALIALCYVLGLLLFTFVLLSSAGLTLSNSAPLLLTVVLPATVAGGLAIFYAAYIGLTRL
ncbi:MAG: hypothetical protein DRJ68_06595 [Thermoprotei archaeon]|nr:MAG: hypothetical protein DRJ68_06595 [Thermoprotei archaeon]